LLVFELSVDHAGDSLPKDNDLEFGNWYRQANPSQFADVLSENGHSWLSL
jgi:hypothetical protein